MPKAKTAVPTDQGSKATAAPSQVDGKATRSRVHRRAQGTVTERAGGKYLIRWTVGVRADGTQIRSSRVVPGPKSAAEAKLRELLTAKDMGNVAVARKLKVGAWIEEWLTSWSTGKAPNTIAHYRKLAKYVPPTFMNRYLRDVTPEQVQALLAELQAASRVVRVSPDGTPWTAVKEREYRRALRKAGRDAKALGSARAERRRRQRISAKGVTVIPDGPTAREIPAGGARSVAGVRTLLRAAFARAVKLRYMGDNPASGRLIDAPEYRPTRRRSCTDVEADTLYRAAMGHPRGAYVLMLLTTGLRPSELLGLRWVDIEGDAATIRHSLTRLPGGGWELKSTKTEAGERTVFVLPSAAEALARERERQGRARDAVRAAGVPWQETGFIFTTDDGTPYDDAGARRRLFDPIVAEARKAMESVEAETGAKFEPAPYSGISPYNLRHTAATMLVRDGEALSVVAATLGHSDPKFTARQYVHTNNEQVRRAQQKLVSRFEKPTPDPPLPSGGKVLQFRSVAGRRA